MNYRLEGETHFVASMIAKADGTPITTGTVNLYITDHNGSAGALRWFRDSDNSWQASETVAHTMTVLGSYGLWYADLTNSPFTAGYDYEWYANESGSLNAAGEGGHVRAVEAVTQVDLIDAPNATAITAIQDGLATLTRCLSEAKLTQLEAAIGTGTVASMVSGILGTALTETSAGYLAAAIKKFFDVATPTGTINSLPAAAANAAGGLPTAPGAAFFGGMSAPLVKFFAAIASDSADSDAVEQMSSGVGSGFAFSSAVDSLNAISETIRRGIVSGQVDDLSASTTVFATTLTEATNDHYNGGVLVFTSGALLGQARRILDYAGDTKTVTLESALTEAPADEVSFMILGRIEE